MNTRATDFNVKATKGRKVIYWASTALVAIAFAVIGAADVAGLPAVVGGLVKLGYPTYFATILGVWALLGSTAIILPGLPRLKEWAYAGMFFTLSGAALSHSAAGDTVGHIVVPLALLVAVMLSWKLRPVRLDSGRSSDKASLVTTWLFWDKTPGASGATRAVVRTTPDNL